MAPEVLALIKQRVGQLPRLDAAGPFDRVPEGWQTAEEVNSYRQLVADAQALLVEIEFLNRRSGVKS
jgi:hypothetical protein